MKKHAPIVISISCMVLGAIILAWTFFPKMMGKNTNSDTQTTITQPSDARYSTQLDVGSQTIWVEVADTQDKKIQGLSGRKQLDPGTGMVFPIDPPQQVVFWMPDMFISIDIIYIKDNMITEIFNSVPFFPEDTPKSDLPRYRSAQPIDMVLEVPAGWSNANGIVVGTEVAYVITYAN